MTAALSLLCRVVRHRIRSGELIEDILQDYPRLTEKELDQIRSCF